MSDDPYRAPSAALEPNPFDSGRDPADLQEPPRLALGRGWGWIREAYGLFKRQPLTWIGIAVVFYLLNVGISLIPGIGNLVSPLLGLVLAGGIFYAGLRTDREGGVAFRDLFRGFGPGGSRLLAVGAFYLVGSLIVGVVNITLGASLGYGSEMAGVYLGTLDTSSTQLPPVFWVILVAIPLTILPPFFMAVAFAPALVLINNVPVARALRMSFAGCLRNLLPMLFYSVALMLLLGCLVAIPLALSYLPIFIYSMDPMPLLLVGGILSLLGGLLAVAVISLSGYTAYRDIFYPTPA